MAHAQQQILDALKSLLIVGATMAGVRVFVDREDPLQASELPAILIDEGEEGERSETEDLSGSEVRECSFMVACVMSSVEAAAARDFGLAVEKLIAGNLALRQLAREGPYLLTNRRLQNGDGDRLLSGRMHTWRIAYAVEPNAPDVIT